MEQLSVREIDTPNATQRAILVLISCVLIMVPFFAVDYPPITDLPQQIAQIRLFLETWYNSVNSPYQIQWTTPYSLSYLVIGLAWLIFGPVAAGKAAMLFIGLLTVIMIHRLAAKNQRSAEAAVIASAFFFNHVVYWGFYSFALGWPVFLLWVELTSGPAHDSRYFYVKITIIALLLYMSHVLWLITASLWLITHDVLHRVSVKELAKKALVLAPLFLAIAVWYPMFAQSQMATPPLWVSGPIDRLGFTKMTDAILGGIYGPAEPLLFIIAIGWMITGLIQNRLQLRIQIHWDFFSIAVLLLVFVLLLPDKYMNTIRFGQRWAPIMMVFFILATPSPKLSASLRSILAVSVLLFFVLATTITWKNFQDLELTGLREALNELPENQRVIGISMLQESAFIKGHPFIQIFAYSQVIKGGRLNFSFAEFSPCLVVYKEGFVPKWTQGLEWFPTRLQVSDLQYFDYLIFQGSEEMQQKLIAGRIVSPITSNGRWRLYRTQN